MSGRRAFSRRELPAPSSRLAHVAVPDLPIQVERRRRSELRGRPVVVVGPPEGRGNGSETGWSGGRPLVLAASDEARVLGVTSGQTPRQAEHLCPEALVVAADWTAYGAAFEALLAVLGACSPVVWPDRAAWGVDLDVGGLELLFGPPQPLARELVRRVARAGLRARAGLGPNRLVARLAAGLAGAGDCVVVGPSEATTFLATLPVDRLPLGEESRERLELLGVRTFGHLLRLPRAALTRQVGPDAAALVRAAEAEAELLASYRPAEWLEAEADLGGASELDLVLRRLVAELTDRLRERSLGAGTLRLRLIWARDAIGARRADEHDTAERRLERLVALNEPTSSAATLLEVVARLARELARGDEGARPPDLIALALGDLEQPGGRQVGLFEGRHPRREQAARTVEELAERFRGRLRAPAFGA